VVGVADAVDEFAVVVTEVVEDDELVAASVAGELEAAEADELAVVGVVAGDEPVVVAVATKAGQDCTLDAVELAGAVGVAPAVPDVAEVELEPVVAGA
jgi:hypothetical protein